MIYISFDRVSSLLLSKVVLKIFGHMVSEIWIVKVNVIKWIKILKFDENSRFYKMLLEFDKFSKNKIIINGKNFHYHTSKKCDLCIVQ